MLGPMTMGALSSGAGAELSLLTDLVAYWKLDEASGTRADSVGSLDLSDNNTVTQAAGKVDNAAQFTSANSEYLDGSNPAALSPGNADFTIAAWVYLDTLQHQTVVSKYLSTGDKREYLVQYIDGVGFRFGISPNGASAFSVDATTFGVASVDTWYLVIVWHDAINDTENIQINDGAVDSRAHSSGVFQGTADFRIGAHGTGSYWSGRIDEVGFWSRVLTSDERSALYNGGDGVTYPFDGTSPASATLSTSSLSAAPVSSTQIDLDWTNGSSNEDGIKIERSTDGASWSQIDSIAAGSTGYSDTGLTADTKYYYRVRAFGGGENEAYSNWAVATPTSLLDSLESAWMLDEESGGRVDAHGGNDLSNNSVGNTGLAKLYNRAASLGSGAQSGNNHLRIADNASLSVGGGASFSFAAWVKAGDKSADLGIMGKDASGDRGYGLIYDQSADRFAWHIGDGGSNIQRINADTFGSPSTDTWYLIVGWYDASGPTIGVSVNDSEDTAEATVTPGDNAAGFVLGRQGDFTGAGRHFVSGAMDGANFWKKALSSAERTQLYNSGAGMMYPFGPTTAPALPALDSDEFMLAAIPDTQRYMADDTDELETVMNWIVAHDGDADKKIEHVLHVGDVAKSGSATEFARADVEFDILDSGGVRYLVTVGNHDYDGGSPNEPRGDDTTEFNVAFPQSRFTGQTGWSGDFEDGTLSDNAYWTRTIGGNDYIFITMEFAPRQAVVDWADALLTTHSAKTAIISTHHWLDDSAERITASHRYSGDNTGSITDNNDADEMWDELVKQHDNIALLVSGHWGRGWRQDENVNDVLVLQTTYAHHGEGWLRLVAIKPSDGRIDNYTYNPTYDAWSRIPNDEFSVAF